MSTDEPDAGLTTPLSPAEKRLLRGAVVDHIRGDRRTARPALLHVGTPGGFTASAALADAPTDFGTRVELIHVLIRLTERHPIATPSQVPWVWISRSGPHEIGDIEMSYLGPAMHAFSEAEEPLTFFVVTRRGWFDPRSGAERTWSRLRVA